MLEPIYELGYLLRIIIAFLLGFLIGLERKMRYKEAGIKTHAIVCVGSCLMMVVSKYGFADTGGADTSRVAAQIVSGIGFLGAGIIMYRRDSLRGVTTAAGIWATAGVGMAAGAGIYIVATGTTVIIIFIQWLTRIPVALFKTKRYYIYRIKFDCNPQGTENESIKKLFNIRDFSRVNYYSTGEGVRAEAEISTNQTLSDEEIKCLVFDNSFIVSVERIFQMDGKA